jgi:DNA-binding transcriptional LysR family regulator
LQQALAGSDAAPQGRLLIGAVPTAMPLAARFAARLVERHPGLLPELRSLPSQDIENGLDTLAIDLGLGYTDRLASLQGLRLQAWPQIEEHHLLLCRAAQPGAALQVGPPLRWADAAALKLCMLSPDMHNRALLDAHFRRLGLQVRPVLQTNSVLAMLAAVQGSGLAAVLPGALVKMVAQHGGLQAHTLVEPELRTPLGFMTAHSATARPSRALQAALRLAQDPAWLADAAAHSGAPGG